MSFKQAKFKPWHMYGNILLNIVAYVSLALGLYYGTVQDYLYILLCYTIIGINEQAFFHRMYTHRSWNCPKWIKFFGLWISNLSLLGPVILWVALHRGHHRYNDTEKDPHSPLYMSNWKIQFLSSTLKFDYRLAADVAKDKLCQMFTQHYYLSLLIAYTIFAYFFGIDKLFLILFAATGLALLLSNCINTWHHGPVYWFGQYRNTQILPDTSKNDLIMGYIMFDGWHNNHHTDPGRYYYGKRWWEIDLCGIYIYLISTLTGYGSSLKRTVFTRTT